MICPKCQHERTTNDDPLIPEYQCPKCGIIYAKYKASKVVTEPVIAPMAKERLMSAESLMLANMKIDSHKTNHILHLLLSIFTFSIWILIWVIIAAINTSRRNEIKEHVGMPQETNIAKGMLVFVAAINILVFIAAIKAFS